MGHFIDEPSQSVICTTILTRNQNNQETKHGKHKLTEQKVAVAKTHTHKTRSDEKLDEREDRQSLVRSPSYMTSGQETDRFFWFSRARTRLQTDEK